MEQKIDIDEHKKFITDLEAEIRKDEIEEARLLEQKSQAETQKEDAVKDLADLGYTPENVDEGIDEIDKTIKQLRASLDRITLKKNDAPTGDSDDEPVF